MSFCVLILYVRWSPRMKVFRIEEGFLAGMMTGIFVALSLEGSWNVLRKFGKRGHTVAAEVEKEGRRDSDAVSDR